MSEQQYAVGYVLSFYDDGEDEEQVLHVGTLKDCEYVAENTPAVAYSGSRPLKGAQMVIVEVAEDA